MVVEGVEFSKAIMRGDAEAFAALGRGLGEGAIPFSLAAKPVQTTAKATAAAARHAASESGNVVRSAARAIRTEADNIASVLRADGEFGRIDLSADLDRLSAFDRTSTRQRVLAAIAESESARNASRFDINVALETARFGDISSNGRGIVLFSGRDAFDNSNSSLAQRFATINNRVTLNQTEAGNKFEELAIFERFALRSDGSINQRIADQTIRVFDIASDRFVRQAPSGLPVFGFVNGARPNSVFSRVELPAIRESGQSFIPLRAVRSFEFAQQK